MTITKHSSIMRLGLVALVAGAMIGCGGGGGGGTVAPPPPPATNLAAAIAAAAAQSANDGPNDGSNTVSNPSVGFAVIQNAGTPAVTLHSPLTVNFTVFDNGNVVQGLRLGNEADATNTGANLTACSSSTTVNGNPVTYANNVKFAVAKINPGSNGNPDEWQALIFSGTNGSHHPTTDPIPSPSNNPTADTTPGAGPTSTLTFHPEGYYTYTFSTDVKDGTFNTTAKNNDGTANTGADANHKPWATGGVMTNGVTMAKDGTTVYRLVLTLCYPHTNPAGQVSAVIANPYFDFTMGANGNATQVTNTDPANGPYTRVMADVRSCNSCHSQLQPHSRRVDTQYCVVCHNSSMEVTGFNPGDATNTTGRNGLSLKTLVHALHAGRKLTQAWPSPISSLQDVGFPQDLRNCTKCHTADPAVAGRIDATTGGPDGTVAPVATATGDNWFNAPSKEACLTCHDDVLPGSPKHVMLGTGNLGNWYTVHNALSVSVATPDSGCLTCHGPGQTWSADVVHWNQQIVNRVKYQYNIISTTFTAPTNAATGSLQVTYSVTDPTNANMPYDLTADCAPGPVCDNFNKFQNVSLLFGYYNYNTTALADYTSYNNGGSSASAKITTGAPQGGGIYKVTLTIPMNTATMKAQGTTARLIMYGEVMEPAKSIVDHLTALPVYDPTFQSQGLPPGVAAEPAFKGILAPVAVPVATKDMSISGTAVARRDVVKDFACDNCHGVLGSVSGSNIIGGGTVVVPGLHGGGSTYYAYSTAFHTSGMTSAKACVICHDVGRLSSSEAQTAAFYTGLGLPPTAYNESFTFRRYIHGIHSAGAGSVTPIPGELIGKYPGRAMPFLHGQVFNGTGDNYAEDVTYPAPLDDCTECHVQNPAGTFTFTADQGPLGAVMNQCNTALANQGFNSQGVDFDLVTAGIQGNYNTCTAPNKQADPLLWNVISPQATVCSSCHDGLGATNHMINVGGATFGTTAASVYPGSEYGMVLAGGPDGSGGPNFMVWDKLNGTQKAIVGSGNTIQGSVFEACDGCHGNTSGGQNGIDGIRVLDVHTHIYNLRLSVDSDSAN